MKNAIPLLIAGALFAFSCNNQPADPVETADSTNEAKQDQAPVESDVQKNTSDFLVKAADGGMAEVAAGKLGEQKASNKAVKDFAAMMVTDHTAANEEVKALATKLNITLPAAPSEEHQKKAADLSEKKAKDFDKDFMDMMVADHKKTIDLFKDASDDDINADVKAFISNTIPKLESHLAMADSIQKKMK
ncbi:MAG: DUF4142 domain-containing protein [Agriterribacter sp.]